jgi:hypothetical protein
VFSAKEIHICFLLLFLGFITEVCALLYRIWVYNIYIYIYIYIVVVWRTRASTWERLLYSSEACSLLHGQKRLIVVSPTLSHGDASSKVVHVLWFSVVWRRPSFFFPLFSLSYMAFSPFLSLLHGLGMCIG